MLGYSDGTNKSGYGLGKVNQALRDGIAAKKAKLDAAVNSIISTIPADAPDVVKQLLIYDRIIIDSNYNLSAVWDGYAEDNWTAYGVMIHKKGVCESYSEAFQLLCLKVGICCTTTVGKANGVEHQWNAVLLEGQWYACDITFDDPVGLPDGETMHTFFNLTTAQMEESNHQADISEKPSPQCNGTKYSYANYFGQ